MAEAELGALYGTRTGRGASTWVGLAGALTSLALVAGVGIWGYRLMERDANGVPVVRALAGPMRIEPADPGGERMAYQGLAVNQVAAAGEAGDIADALTLAPPAPSLLDQDLAKAELGDQPLPDVGSATDDAVLAALDEVEEDETLVDAAVDGAETVAAAPSDVVVIPASIAGVSRSLRPPSRPERIMMVSAPAAGGPAALVPEEDIEVLADTLPVGSRLVQLGAFETPEIARAEWVKIAENFADVMGDKRRVIQEATAGGKTFYRLRVAGFEDLADARRFCATLLADKSNPLCVPVATR
jgi:hypothetical protein